jgi:hypothetical protein
MFSQPQVRLTPVVLLVLLNSAVQLLSTSVKLVVGIAVLAEL